MVDEQCAQSFQVWITYGVGEQSEVLDAMKAFGEDVDEESADELLGLQGHRLIAFVVLGTIVLPFKRNTVLIIGHESAIGYGDAMGVSGEVFEHGLRSGKGALGVHHPVDVA